MGSERGTNKAQDRVLTAKIMGAAVRHAAERPFDLEVAVAEVKQLAAGRVDLLAEAAGTYLGTVQLDAHHWYYPLAAQICLDAGADRDAVPYCDRRHGRQADRGQDARYDQQRPSCTAGMGAQVRRSGTALGDRGLPAS